MRSKILLASGLIMFMATQTASAASPVKPPIDELLAKPERNRVVVAEAREKLVSPKLRFVVSEQLSGTSPDELILRADPDIYKDVVVGESYIIGWTDQRKKMLVREGYEDDPDGPSVVQIKGMNALTVYKNSPEIRYLITSRQKPDQQEAGLQIDAVLAQIQRDDLRGRDLVIWEILLTQGLAEQMTAVQADRLKTILQKSILSPKHRDYLLQVALRLPEELRSPWIAEEFRRVIIKHGTTYVLSSWVPGLVRTSARGLGETGEKSDFELLGILLYANNPGVSKAALKSMHELDPAATRIQVELALKRGWTHDLTSKALKQYLKQNPPKD